MIVISIYIMTFSLNQKQARVYSVLLF